MALFVSPLFNCRPWRKEAGRPLPLTRGLALLPIRARPAWVRPALFTLLLVCAPWSHAQITVVGTSTTPAPASSAVASLTINRPAGAAANDVLIAHIASRGASGVTITAPPGWTLVDRTNTLLYVAQAVYSHTVGVIGSEPSSYTWTLSSSQRAAISLVALRGVHTTSPVNAADGTAESFGDTTITAAGITTTVANTLLLAMYSVDDGAATFTAPTGMTEQVDINTSAGPNGISMAMYSETRAASGATGTRIGTSSVNPNAAVGTLVALKPAAAAVVVDHYELWLPSASVACLPSSVTVTACSNSSHPCTSATTTISGATATLATSGATLAATTVTFNGSGVATTTLSYPGAANGAAVSVTLSGESSAAGNPRQCCPNGSSCTATSSCSTTFNSAGFIFAASAGGGSATLPAQTAGTASGTYTLRAVKTGTTTQACESALTGSTTVNWAYQCNSPTTCSSGNRMTLTGNSATTIAANPNSGVSSTLSVPMTFDANGNAPFSFNYADVGQVTLAASKSAGGSLLSALTGTSNAFVVRPGGFAVSSILQTAAPQLANPAAASAAGARFVKAGESFSASVTAQTSGGVTTPNYGRETSPEGVLLTRTLVLPAGGATGTLGNASITGGSFSAGVATATNLSFSEVGIITLTPSVADGDYLGAGNVTGSTTGNIGRFVPAQFALSGGTLTQRSALGCAPASGFSYLGENFRLGFTLTAQNSAGATTTNYTGSFAKLDPTSASGWNLAGRDATTVFTPASTRLALGSATGSFANGVASGITLTANAARATAPDGPFNAAFGVAPVDSDGVGLGSFNMASTSGGSNDRASVANVALRFGRLRLDNAIGAADRALAVPASAQYWDGSGFSTNTLDSCTTVAASAVNFGNLRGTLSTADTAISSAIALSAGVGTLRLSAPAGGRSGTADIALSLGAAAADASCLQPWTPGSGDAATAGANLAFLRGAWCASSYGQDPSARATFGRQRDAGNSIYRRENY